MNKTTTTQLAIGAVSRMTGLPLQTIRVWEKRYRAVQPNRDARGNRLYSESDVKRLKLLASLVNGGHSIGRIAKLPHPALAQMLDTATETLELGNSVSRSRELLVAGAHCSELIQKLDSDAVDSMQALEDMDALLEAHPRGAGAVVVIETDSVNEADAQQLVDWIEASRPLAVLLFYRFIDRSARERLRARALRMLRGPASSDALTLFLDQPAPRIRWSHASNQPEAMDEQQVNAPVFSRHRLAELSRASSTLKCECPQHLAEILIGLRAFERYSQQCINQSETDRDIHQMLATRSGQARAHLEGALAELLAAEGVPVAP